MDSIVKHEIPENPEPINPQTQTSHSTTNTTAASTSSTDSDIDGTAGSPNKRKKIISFGSTKKPKVEDYNSVVPPGFLAPLHVNGKALPATTARTSTEEVLKPMPLSILYNNQEIHGSNAAAMTVAVAPVARGCKQFWRAGDYEEVSAPDSSHSSVGMDHVRVHPKFLHSNATSHKWALGAFAELLDNSLDESMNGATYVHVDVLKNQKDGSFMLLVEDNGGGMNPHNMRRCMSLGYSYKSKMPNTIGQYGNGFKTSTMRLGADVIVFSHCKGSERESETLSIGLLSYTFLKATGQEDIVVPMVDLEKRGESWANVGKSSEDWNATLETILRWSPFISAEDLYQQFNFLENQGTRIIIYNLWEDDEGNLELDFGANPHDIQIRGVNRDEKMIKMAEQYPSSRHFVTYQHSLKSYAAILYLKLPKDFRIILRGKDIKHHDIVKDMKLAQEIVYKPTQIAEGNLKNNTNNVVAKGMIGFVKDADHHIDVQGFNVYHKNRLIKPFWRVWNAAGSDGRGVIGFVEANFVEPAHDKQGFERTTPLSRLEARLNAIQKNYWNTKCHEIGYAPRRPIKNQNCSGSSSENNGQSCVFGSKRSPLDSISSNKKVSSATTQRLPSYAPVVLASQPTTSKIPRFQERSSPDHQIPTASYSKEVALRLKNPESRDSRLNGTTDKDMNILLRSLLRERDIKMKVETQLEEKIKVLEAEKERSERLDGENKALVDLIENDRNTWAEKEKNLTQKLENASKMIEELKEELKQLKRSKTINFKMEPQQ